MSHLQAGEWLDGQLLPLLRNLQPGDSILLSKHLGVARNAENHHRLISDLVEVCERNPWPEMLEVMLFLYQTSPCTNCRRQVYQTMLREKLVPEWMAAEWPYDVTSMDTD